MSDDDDDVFLDEDDFDDEPDALCADCGDDVFCTDRHFTEGFERFGALLCAGCFEERCEADPEEDEPSDV